MKRFIVLTGLMALVLVPMFGQVIDVPDSWQDLYDNYLTFFATYLGVAGVATFLAEYVIRLLKLTTRFLKVLFLALVSVGLCFLASAINIGFLAESAWWETLLWAGLVTAAAAGLRSGNLLFLKTIVDFVIGLIKSKEPTE